MQPTRKSIAVNGIDLCYFEWSPTRQTKGEAPLVFAHATGFHARVWDAVIERLGDRLIYSLDLRGHGRSGGEPITDLRQFSDDIIGFVDALEITGAIGVGHSMGAHTLLQAAFERAAAFSRLVLFDPVILAPEFYAPAHAPNTPDAPHPASKRKRKFDSPEAMMQRFQDRDPYKLFEPRVLADYCKYGLLPRADGEGYELACAPEMEASVYDSGRSNPAILETAKAVQIPALIVRAKQTELRDFKSSPTWPQLAAIMPEGEDLYRPDRTHFHPFEDPKDAALIISDFSSR